MKAAARRSWRRTLLVLAILIALFLLFELIFRPRVLCHTLASGLYSSGRHSAAERIWNGALDPDDGDWIPENSLGKALYREGKYPEAEELLGNAAQEDDAIPAACYDLGNALYRNEKLDAALREYKKAMLLDPDDQDAKSNYELVLNRQGYEPPPPPGEGSENEDEGTQQPKEAEDSEEPQERDAREQYRNMLDALDQKELFDRQKENRDQKQEERWW